MSKHDAAQELYNDVAEIRTKLHAANRPMMREGLRLELRSDCDTALKKYRRTMALRGQNAARGDDNG